MVITRAFLGRRLYIPVGHVAPAAPAAAAAGEADDQEDAADGAADAVYLGELDLRGVPDAGRKDWRRLAKSFCSRCSLLAASGRKLVAGTCSVTPNLLLSGSSLHFRIDCSAAVKASKLEAIIEACAAAELVLRLDIAEAGLARGVNSLGGEFIRSTACVLLNMGRLATSAAAPAAAAATFEAAVEAAAAASAVAEAAVAQQLLNVPQPRQPVSLQMPMAPGPTQQPRWGCGPCNCGHLCIALPLLQGELAGSAI